MNCGMLLEWKMTKRKKKGGGGAEAMREQKELDYLTTDNSHSVQNKADTAKYSRQY